MQKVWQMFFFLPMLFGLLHTDALTDLNGGILDILKQVLQSNRPAQQLLLMSGQNLLPIWRARGCNICRFFILLVSSSCCSSKLSGMTAPQSSLAACTRQRSSICLILYWTNWTWNQDNKFQSAEFSAKLPASGWSFPIVQFIQFIYHEDNQLQFYFFSVLAVTVSAFVIGQQTQS